jgi:hypothetical protein
MYIYTSKSSKIIKNPRKKSEKSWKPPTRKNKTGHLQWEKPHHTWNFGPSQSPVLSTKGYLRFLARFFWGGATDQENVSKVRIEQTKKNSSRFRGCQEMPVNMRSWRVCQSKFVNRLLDTKRCWAVSSFWASIHKFGFVLNPQVVWFRSFKHCCTSSSVNFQVANLKKRPFLGMLIDIE